MADNPITVSLPADLPVDWAENQVVAPEGVDVGLSDQHGYNYLMQQVNAAQQAASQIGQAFPGLATLDENGKLVQDIDCGVWDTDPVEEHNATATAHANLLVDGNNVEAVDISESLEEHMANPLAHQNLVIDGNAGQ